MAQTPKELLESLKKSGLLVVRGTTYFFIPLAKFSEFKLPKEFQKDFPGISPDYFKMENIGANNQNPTDKSLVYSEIDKILSRGFRVADGVNQAVWIDAADPADAKPVSRAEESGQVLFQYDKGTQKIIVDMSKGGKPSTDL
jgi:hypothetical protein